jgi:hypothetical protein
MKSKDEKSLVRIVANLLNWYTQFHEMKWCPILFSLVYSFIHMWDTSRIRGCKTLNYNSKKKTYKSSIKQSTQEKEGAKH